MKKHKIIYKTIAAALGLGMIFSTALSVKKSHAAESSDKLQTDISQRMNKLGGDWQVAIKSLDGDLDLYFTSDSNPKSLPAASSIKTYIGLCVLNQIERGDLKESPQTRNDISAMLKVSDNQAANRLIDKVGGFKAVNRTIKDITGSTNTSLNRYFLQKGEENMANAVDLNQALINIYKASYVNIDNSSFMAKAMENTSTKYQKLLGGLTHYDRAINKSGELPDRGVENDSAIVWVNKKAYAVTVLSKTNNIQNRKPQLDAMKDVGKLVDDYIRNTDSGNNDDGGAYKPGAIYYYKKVDLDESYLGKK